MKQQTQNIKEIDQQNKSVKYIKAHTLRSPSGSTTTPQKSYLKSQQQQPHRQLPH